MEEQAFVGAHWAPIVGQGLGLGPSSGPTGGLRRRLGLAQSVFAPLTKGSRAKQRIRNDHLSRCSIWKVDFGNDRAKKSTEIISSEGWVVF
jgi:hypothetical protein